MSDILALIPTEYLPYALAVGGIASIVAALMPPPVAGAVGAYATVYRIVNFAAVNIGHAKNASAPIPVAAQ